MTDKMPSEATQRPIVLIVEDELFVRMDAANIIEKAGFGVVEACNADEAIEILETRDDISVVVTDVAMPGSMDGVRLAATIRDRWPPIELILTSGKVRLPSQWLPDRGKFLAKPYPPQHLVAAVQEFARLN